MSIPILTTKKIDKYSKDEYGLWETAIISPEAVATDDISESIYSVPILLCHTSPVQLHNSSEDRDKETISASLDIADKSIYNWICVDDTVGAFRSWSIYGESGSIEWYFETVFTSTDTVVLFKRVYPSVDIQILDLLHIDSFTDTLSMSSFHGIDAMFIPYKNGSATT